MRKILFFLLLASFNKEFNSTDDQDYKIEYDLVQNIFKDYAKSIRPSKLVKIFLDTSLKQIVSLDERNQILTTSIHLSLIWQDPRLMFNSSNFNGLDSIKVSATQLWLPDLFVINTADTNGFITISNSNLAILKNSGFISLTISLTGLKTRCDLNIWKFPFDTQICEIQIGSWQRETTEIDLEINQEFKRLNSVEFLPHLIWDQISYESYIVNKTSRFQHDDQISKDFYHELIIKRKPLYYMINDVYPYLVINLVNLISYFLPFALQATLTITTFINMGIMSMRVNNDIPVQSECLPLISLYILLCLFYAFISFSWFVYLEIAKNKKDSPPLLIRFSLYLKHEIIKLFKIKIKKETFCIKQNKEAVANEQNRFSKQETEKIIVGLNYVAFVIMVLSMFISFVAIWLVISTP